MPIIVRVNSQQSACHDAGQVFVNVSYDQCKDGREGGIATKVKMLHVEVGLASVDAVFSKSGTEIFGGKSCSRFILQVCCLSKREMKQVGDDVLWQTVHQDPYFGHSPLHSYVFLHADTHQQQCQRRTSEQQEQEDAF